MTDKKLTGCGNPVFELSKFVYLPHEGIFVTTDLEGDVIDAVRHQVGDEDHEEVGGDAGLRDGSVDQKRNIDKVDEDD